MTPRPLHTMLITAAVSLTLVLGALVAPAQDGRDTTAPTVPQSQQSPDTPSAPGDGIAVGNLVYADGRTGVCFADQFLTTYARETGQDVQRSFAAVTLDSDELFNLPFVVMTGEKAFTLSDDEKQNLKTYLDNGGFVLASAGCSNQAWANSFMAVMDELYGRDALTELDTDHALFHSLYDIDQVEVRRRSSSAPVLGMEIDGRVRMIFSPVGLNDTGNAGRGCCCCGGNEIRNARQINANILAYALTH